MEFPKTLIFLRPLLMTPLFLGRALGSPDRFFFFCLIVPIVVVGRWSLSSFDFSHLISVLSQCLVSFIFDNYNFFSSFFTSRLLFCCSSSLLSDPGQSASNTTAECLCYKYCCGCCCYFTQPLDNVMIAMDSSTAVQHSRLVLETNLRLVQALTILLSELLCPF